MNIYISGKTDIGIERANNEDAFSFCSDLNKSNWDVPTSNGYIKNGKLGSISIVADGMGGANAGEMASSIAIESLKSDLAPSLLSEIIGSDEKIKNYLSRIILNANDAILKHIESDPDTIGMGTTIVLIWILNEKAYIGWCGDSRCYVFNPKQGLKCLSKDHSYVQELIDKGEITVKQSFNHPDSSIITRCLGDCDTSAEPEILVYEIRKHDQFLLCSDGLCGYCNDRIIEKTFYKEYLNVDKCCNAMIDLALKTGGQDNISVINISTIDDNEFEIPYSLKDKIKRFLNSLF